MIFPLVMYWCESWAIKKAEHQVIDAFELWCWKRFKSPLDRKEIKPVNPEENQCWIFIGMTDAKAEAPIPWPPTQWKRPWCLERLKAKEGGSRGWDGKIASNSMDVNLSKLHKMLKDREAWCTAVRGVTKNWTRLSDWTTTINENCAKLLGNSVFSHNCTRIYS